MIPTRSLLGRWHTAVSDPARKEEVAKLAEQVQALLSGPRLPPERMADSWLYDNFVSADGVLFRGLDPVPLGKRPATTFGLTKERFGNPSGLKRWHREDDELVRLFLTDEDRRKLDRLWLEHRFISRQPVVENADLSRFIDALTPPQPKDLLRHYEALRVVFRNRAEAFRKDEDDFAPNSVGRRRMSRLSKSRD